MSDYSKTTDFTAKDNAASGQATKLILGADFDLEFGAVATAVATKYDSGDLASQVQAEAATSSGADNTVLLTPLRLWNWASDNAGVVEEMQALTSPGADRIYFFDNGTASAAFLTVSTGLTISGTNLTTNDSAIVHDSLSGFVANEHIDHSSVTLTAGYGISGGGDLTTSRSFDLSGAELTTFTDVSIVDETADGVVVLDNNTFKSLPWNKGGIHVETFTASVDVNDTDYGIFKLLANGASGATKTFNSATNAAHVGAVILLGARDTGDLTLAVGGSSTFTSTFEQGGTTNRTIRAGGTGMAIHVGSDEWMLVGDIT